MIYPEKPIVSNTLNQLDVIEDRILSSDKLFFDMNDGEYFSASN
jgi:hypothetical protein